MRSTGEQLPPLFILVVIAADVTSGEGPTGMLAICMFTLAAGDRGGAKAWIFAPDEGPCGSLLGIPALIGGLGGGLGTKVGLTAGHDARKPVFIGDPTSGFVTAVLITGV